MREDTKVLIHLVIIAFLCVLSVDRYVDPQVINWAPDALLAMVFGYVAYIVWALRTDFGRRPGMFVRWWIRLGIR